MQLNTFYKLLNLFLYFSSYKLKAIILISTKISSVKKPI